MRARIYGSVDEIGDGRIAPLAGSPIDFGYGLLRAIERSLWGDLQVRYLAVEDAGRLLAFAPVYLGRQLNFNALLPGWLQAGYRRLIQAAGTAAGYRHAVVGSLLSDRGWIPMHPAASGTPVIARLLRAADELARDEGADFCLIRDLHRDFPAELAASIEAAGYRRMCSLPTIRVNTDFDSFDGYLRSLSKNGRKHCRKTFRKAKEHGLTLRVLEDFGELVPALYPLFRGTYRQARYQFEELSPGFFDECAAMDPAQRELIVCEREGRIAGALLTLFLGGQQYNKRLGMDYAQPDTGLIYMLLNYQGIATAIGRRARVVCLGQSTYTPKTRMGGELEDQFVYIKPHRWSVAPGLVLERVWLRRYAAARIGEQLARGLPV